MQGQQKEKNPYKDYPKIDNPKKGLCNYFLGSRHCIQGQNNIDADASANCDQGILGKIFKRTTILQKVINAKKDDIKKENPKKDIQQINLRKIIQRNIIQRKIIEREVFLGNMVVASIYLFLTVAHVIETFSTFKSQDCGGDPNLALTFTSALYNPFELFFWKALF